MIFKTKLINIKKNNIRKKIFIRKQIKKIILKSIIQNKNNKPILRSLAYYKYSQTKYSYSITKQNNNLCLYSGKIKSVYKNYNMSRHLIKKISYENNLQNTKIVNW